MKALQEGELKKIEPSLFLFFEERGGNSVYRSPPAVLKKAIDSSQSLWTFFNGDGFHLFAVIDEMSSVAHMGVCP